MLFRSGGKNHTLDEIAQMVSKISGVAKVYYENTNDLRSYRINSSKIFEQIGFKTSRSVEKAIFDILQAFDAGIFTNPLSNPAYFNIKRMQQLGLG